MLDSETRSAVLTLQAKGHGIRAIARTLDISRSSVREILRTGRKEVPLVERPEKLTEELDRIRELHAACKGNLVRVHEKLADVNMTVPYSTLTGFCRRHGIGVEEKVPSGHYDFAPGEEMQHDTSPHRVKVGDREMLLQCASLVLCFSRMLFVQIYCTFNRFIAKVFLTEAFRFFQGAAGRCVIDNTSVIVSHGTGANAVMAPEMEAFGERFDFKFMAHELGDVNRSARVERPFHYIENNFYVGRTFKDMADLNAQAIDWCNKANARFVRSIQAKPIELFQSDRLRLKPLPLYIPEVYALHHRVVDVDANVHLHTNRYRVPAEAIGRKVEVRETKDRIGIWEKHKLLAEYERKEDRQNAWFSLPRFHGERTHRPKHRDLPPSPEEQALHKAGPELSQLVNALRKVHGGRAAVPMRTLHRMFLDYPTDVLCKAIGEANAHGLLDLKRIERMVLRRIAGDFFRLPTPATKEADDER